MCSMPACWREFGRGAVVMGCNVCCGVWTQWEKFPGSAAVCVESPQPEGAPRQTLGMSCSMADVARKGLSTALDFTAAEDP